MAFAINQYSAQYNYYEKYAFGTSNRTTQESDFMGKATSLTTSSDKGKNIGVMTIGSKGYIAEYADSSTEKEPIIKVGRYEVRINDVDIRNATEIEMFALTSYMDDKGTVDNSGMKSFNKMRAYSKQAEYNGFCSGIATDNTAWTQNRDWTAILQNAKESYFKIPEAYGQGLDCQKIISRLEQWAKTSETSAGQSEKVWNKFLAALDSKTDSTRSIANSNILKTNSAENIFNAYEFTEVTTAKYRIVPENEIGGLRIYINGESAGVFKADDLKIQEDAATGTKVLVSDLAGFGGAWYDALPVDYELEHALSQSMGVDDVPHQPLEKYYIGTHAETGIKYLMRPGDEGKGGRVLLCNEADVAKYNALGEEYARKYPNLIKSSREGLIYADFEIRGMAHRAANGIVMTHPDNISYNDNNDATKNWSAQINDKTWDLMLSWLKNHSLDTKEMTSFKYWDDIFSNIGGSYERIWSDQELKQGFLWQ